MENNFKLNNPEKITGFMHKTKGSIELLENQQIQCFYRWNGRCEELQILEIWETRNSLLYRVARFLSKTVLVTYH